MNNRTVALRGKIETISNCENLKYFIEHPGEYAETPEAIVEALDEFQQILTTLHNLDVRLSAIESANVPA